MSELGVFIADRLFVVTGLFRFAIFDGRESSSTFGTLNQFLMGAANPGLLLIPPNLYHGWKNIGTSEGIIINMPDRMYNYGTPDSLDLPWDSSMARDLIPYVW